MLEPACDTRHRVKHSSSEQDRAAGGREARLIEAGDGTIARASVELKHFGRADFSWAYLRWSSRGKTVTRYLGKAYGKSRFRCLRDAWALAREKGYSRIVATIEDARDGSP